MSDVRPDVTINGDGRIEVASIAGQGPPGPPVNPVDNIDGGTATSVYGGFNDNIDCGGAT